MNLCPIKVPYLLLLNIFTDSSAVRSAYVVNPYFSQKLFM